MKKHEASHPIYYCVWGSRPLFATMNNTGLGRRWEGKQEGKILHEPAALCMFKDVVQWMPLIVATSGPSLSGHNNRWRYFSSNMDYFGT